MDFKLAEGGGGGGGTSFNSYYEGTIRQRSTLKMELQTQNSFVEYIEEMITYTTLTMPGPTNSPFLEGLRKEAETTRSRIQKMVPLNIK